MALEKRQSILQKRISEQDLDVKRAEDALGEAQTRLEAKRTLLAESCAELDKLVQHKSEVAAAEAAAVGPTEL